MGTHHKLCIVSNVALLVLSLPKMLLAFRMFCYQRQKYIGIGVEDLISATWLSFFLKRNLIFKLILPEVEVSALINFTFNVNPCIFIPILSPDSFLLRKAVLFFKKVGL